MPLVGIVATHFYGVCVRQRLAVTRKPLQHYYDFSSCLRPFSLGQSRKTWLIRARKWPFLTRIRVNHGMCTWFYGSNSGLTHLFALPE